VFWQVVFNYIDDKDAFQNSYHRFLAERLVYELSASDDYEKMMITELKVRQSPSSTLKITEFSIRRQTLVLCTRQNYRKWLKIWMSKRVYLNNIDNIVMKNNWKIQVRENKIYFMYTLHVLFSRFFDCRTHHSCMAIHCCTRLHSTTRSNRNYDIDIVEISFFSYLAHILIEKFYWFLYSST